MVWYGVVGDAKHLPSIVFFPRKIVAPWDSPKAHARHREIGRGDDGAWFGVM